MGGRFMNAASAVKCVLIKRLLRRGGTNLNGVGRGKSFESIPVPNVIVGI